MSTERHARDDRWAVSSLSNHPRQRRLLSILRDRSHPVTDRDLAVQVAAAEEDVPPSDVTEEKVRQVSLDLHHTILPKLEAIGILDRGPEGISVVDRLPPETLAESLQRRDAADSGDALAAIAEHPERRAVVSVLADRSSPLALGELATELASEDGLPDDKSDLRAKLHHVDLPLFADLRLVEYDADENAIAVRAPLRRIDDLLDASVETVDDAQTAL